MSLLSKKNKFQTFLDFDLVKWPDQDLFPLNLKALNRSVKEVLYNDIEDSSEYIILTGFTSLSNLIDLFGKQDFEKNKKVKILIGFEPNLVGRKKYSRVGLDKEIKDYWLKRGLSIMQGGAVIHLIEKINLGIVEFRFRNKLHAKIYVGDSFAILGSSNFSHSGLVSQDEANIRIKNSGAVNDQYSSIKQIAESYYEESTNYNDKIVDLLKTLIKEVTWQEALARAIAEVLEGDWLNEYKEILTKLQRTKLWPTQWKGLAQAVSILQGQSNVLIADPTGAGKTKLCTAIVLALQHWLYEKGKHHDTESLVICPPLVIDKWANEFKAFNKINHSHISTGLLSNTTGKSKKRILDELSIANILVIDEAHKYLSPESNRTNLLKENKADYRILITATPISKKVEDILRLIELLDVDNLTDEDFAKYQLLLTKPYLGNQTDNIEKLRKFISQFTVRRTKKKLNEEIQKDPSKYLNTIDKLCKFPTQHEKTYETGETASDRAIVSQINDLSQKIKGVTYLTRFVFPQEQNPSEEKRKSYIDRRIVLAKGLSIYTIRAALRSSHVALVEHIEGSAKAMDLFKFSGKNNDTGDKLKSIESLINNGNLPFIHKKFKKEEFPEWLIDENEYINACNEDLTLYRDIAYLAKRLSGERELNKVQNLFKISKRHQNILAFDSTVITLYYLKKVFESIYPDKKIIIASGSESEKETQRLLNAFALVQTDPTSMIALCSDKVSEGVDLQQASCVFLLDTPSVLRIVEQRIGRADRMDTLHDAIDIYWPVDSEEYSLKTDNRLIETNDAVRQIYGSNFEVPDLLKERVFKNVENTQSLINEYKEFVDKDESWTGIHDGFQFIANLKEGGTALIEENLYNEFIGVESEVKTRVSFISSSSNWCFLALRGDNLKSPRWYFIDEGSDIYSDYVDICDQLRKKISIDSISLAWNDNELKKFVDIFKLKERKLLPPKKARALDVAEHILERKLKKPIQSHDEKETLEIMLKMIKAKSDEVVDYERLAEEWISILQPYLKRKRETLKKRKTALNLSSLRSEYKQINLEINELKKIIEISTIAEEVDKRIAACIIGIGQDNNEITPD